MTSHLDAMRLMDRVALLVLQLYHHQADLVINRDLAQVAEYETACQELDGLLARGREILQGEELTQLEAIEASHEKFEKVFLEEIVPEVQHAIDNPLAKASKEADDLMVSISETTNALVAATEKEAEESVRRFGVAQSTVIAVAVGVSLATVILGVILASLVTRSIVRPVKR